MKCRYAIIFLGLLTLLACGLPFGPAVAPTIAVPPTPSQGGESFSVNESLTDMRVASGSSCSPLAADMSGQKVAGTMTLFPNAGPNELRAVMNDGSYTGAAALLSGNCQQTGQRYDVTATFGVDYTATLGTQGAQRCIASSKLVITSLTLQGLPGPLNALAEPIVRSEIPNQIGPHLDDLVVEKLNNGALPAGGSRCGG